MGSHFQAAISRIQEIESRLGIRHAPPPAPNPAAGAVGKVGGAVGMEANRPVSPFPVLLDQAQSNVRLKSLGPVAGPFTSEIEGLITKYADKNGLPVELVRAVVQQESSGNPRSVSAAGAQGLMQLMPGTARGLGVTDSFDPEQNIAGGTKYLSGLMKEFNNDIPMALAAYNAGPPAVRRAGGMPNYAETKQYVQRVLEMMQNSSASAEIR